MTGSQTGRLLPPGPPIPGGSATELNASRTATSHRAGFFANQVVSTAADDFPCTPPTQQLASLRGRR